MKKLYTILYTAGVTMIVLYLFQYNYIVKITEDTNLDYTKDKKLINNHKQYLEPSLPLHNQIPPKNNLVENIIKNEYRNDSIKTLSNMINKPSFGSLIAISLKNNNQLDHICSGSIINSYRNILSNSNHKSFDNNLQWCKLMKSKNNVQIGRSWGSLTREGKYNWDKYKCNELLSLGKLQSCDEKFGWKFLNDWLLQSKSIIIQNNYNNIVSNVTCMRNIKTSTFCEFNNVIIDYSKIETHSGSRSFHSGFLNIYGDIENYGSFMNIPGVLQHHNEVNYIDMTKTCDIIENRPTFIVSNDDIFNLGHYINDVMGIWFMLMISSKQSKTSILINMDGLRVGGPAGGVAHRIMVPSTPDEHGPYIGYYQSWFSEIKKANEYTNKRVCHKELYLPPVPGVAWFWNDWGQVNECSLQAASPLYQSFNVFLRNKWIEQYGLESLVDPPIDYIHIVIEVRAINRNKKNHYSSARYIRNIKELVNVLNTIPNVKVTAQNFAKLSFAKQVSLSHSANIFISMHGAGTTHIFHSALGKSNCCALIELFPDQSIDLYTAQGYGNLARMLGLHHYRYVAKDGSTSKDGTMLDLNDMQTIVSKAIHIVKSRPTCLHSTHI